MNHMEKMLVLDSAQSQSKLLQAIGTYKSGTTLCSLFCFVRYSPPRVSDHTGQDHTPGWCKHKLAITRLSSSLTLYSSCAKRFWLHGQLVLDRLGKSPIANIKGITVSSFRDKIIHWKQRPKSGVCLCDTYSGLTVYWIWRSMGNTEISR